MRLFSYIASSVAVGLAGCVQPSPGPTPPAEATAELEPCPENRSAASPRPEPGGLQVCVSARVHDAQGHEGISSGSGVVARGIVATAAHVIRDAIDQQMPISVSVGDSRYDAQILIYDRMYDHAVLRLLGSPGEQLPDSGLKPCEQPLSVGQSLSLDVHDGIRPGYSVEQLKAPLDPTPDPDPALWRRLFRIKLNGYSESGFSGGGVIDPENKCLAGIISVGGTKSFTVTDMYGRHGEVEPYLLVIPIAEFLDYHQEATRR